MPGLLRAFSGSYFIKGQHFIKKKKKVKHRANDGKTVEDLQRPWRNIFPWEIFVIYHHFQTGCSKNHYQTEKANLKILRNQRCSAPDCTTPRLLLFLLRLFCFYPHPLSKEIPIFPSSELLSDLKTSINRSDIYTALRMLIVPNVFRKILSGFSIPEFQKKKKFKSDSRN